MNSFRGHSEIDGNFADLIKGIFGRAGKPGDGGGLGGIVASSGDKEEGC